jgi:hypothetical protein
MRSARIYITTKGHIIMLLNVAESHVIREGSTLPNAFTRREGEVCLSKGE